MSGVPKIQKSWHIKSVSTLSTLSRLEKKTEVLNGPWRVNKSLKQQLKEEVQHEFKSLKFHLMYALADWWAERDPGERKDVWELVRKQKMDKVDVTDLQCWSLVVPVIQDGYTGRKGQWCTSGLEMVRNQLSLQLFGADPHRCAEECSIFISWIFAGISVRFKTGRQLGKGVTVVEYEHRSFI